MFCTYLTTYSGQLLPRYYIGSSSVERVKSGYRGTVLSKRYKDTWKSEIKTNPHLFSTEIINEFATREEALADELALQIERDVVRSPDYCNMALAQKDGFFGMKKAGISLSAEHSKKIAIAHTGKPRPEHSKAMTGRKRPDHSEKMSGEGNPMFGKPHPNKGKKIHHKRKVCEVCGFESSGSVIARYHNDKCKKKNH